MISFIAWLILANMVAYPAAMLWEFVIRFATNQPTDVEYYGEKYQHIKYDWILSQFGTTATTGGLYMVGDFVMGFVSLVFLAVAGYYALIPMLLLAALLGSRWYFQNKGK